MLWYDNLKTYRILFYGVFFFLFSFYLAVAVGSSGFLPYWGIGTDSARYILPARLPRVVLAGIIGSVLAITGTSLQGLLRNPLVSPYTIGVSSGASLGAVLAIRFGAESWFGVSWGIIPVAGSGSLVAMLFLFILAGTGIGWAGTGMLLAGITISFFCSSAIMFVQYTSSYVESFKMVRWLMGGLDFITWNDVKLASATIPLAVFGLLPLGKFLNLLALGEETAFSSGVNIKSISIRIFAVSSLIVALGVSITGPVAFVGLIVPHMLRMGGYNNYKVLLPASMLFGGGFLIFSDLISRIILAPQQIPAGIVTALLGGPYFLFLLMKKPIAY